MAHTEHNSDLNISERAQRQQGAVPSAHVGSSAQSSVITEGKSACAPAGSDAGKHVVMPAQGVRILQRTPQGGVVAVVTKQPKPLLLSHKHLGAGSQAPVPFVEHSQAQSDTVLAEQQDQTSQVLEAQPVEAQLVEAQPVEAQPVDVQPVEAQPVEVQTVAPATSTVDASLTASRPSVARNKARYQSSSSTTGANRHASAVDTAAAEASQLLKNLDVLKKVKEFNAKQHEQDGSTEPNSEDDDSFFRDYEDDLDSDLSGMHVVQDAKDRAADYELSDEEPKGLSFGDLDFADSDSDYDFADEDDAATVHVGRDNLDAETLEAETEAEEDGEFSSSEPVEPSSSRALVRSSGRSSGNSIGTLIKAAHQVPLLTEEEEKELAHRLKEHDDLEAARRLVMSHLRLVISVARDYTGYKLPLSDLIQEGNIGLMKAVKHFNPDAGVRLAAFAVQWIKSEILEYVIRNLRMVKVATTKEQRRLFFKLRQAKQHLGWMTASERQSLADNLGVSSQDVAVMETRMAGSDIGFDLDEGDNEKGVAVTLSPSSYLEDENSNFAQILENTDYANWELNKLYEALNTLDTRSRHIIKRRWLDEDKATLQELSVELKVSIERVRQLENNAMKKIKSLLLASGVNADDDDKATTAPETLRLPNLAKASSAAIGNALTYKPAASKPAAAKTSKAKEKLPKSTKAAKLKSSQTKATHTKAAKATKVAAAKVTASSKGSTAKAATAKGAASKGATTKAAAAKRTKTAKASSAKAAVAVATTEAESAVNAAVVSE